MTVRVREAHQPRIRKLKTEFCEVHSKCLHLTYRQAIKVALWNSVDYGKGMRISRVWRKNDICSD